ncbi:MAG: hypothetical protein WC211_09970 [Dehalococcoidia bacterium]
MLWDASGTRLDRPFTAADAESHGVPGWGSGIANEVVQVTPIELRYSAEDLRRIRWGFRASAMEERWFVFVQDEWLNVYRVGGLCAKARLTEQGISALHLTASGQAVFAGQDNTSVAAVANAFDAFVQMILLRYAHQH